MKYMIAAQAVTGGLLKTCLKYCLFIWQTYCVC